MYQHTLIWLETAAELRRDRYNKPTQQFNIKEKRHYKKAIMLYTLADADVIKATRNYRAK